MPQVNSILFAQIQTVLSLPVADPGVKWPDPIRAFPSFLPTAEQQTRVGEFIRQGTEAPPALLRLFRPTLVGLRDNCLQVILYGPASLKDSSYLPTELVSASGQERTDHLNREIKLAVSQFCPGLDELVAITRLERLTADIARAETEDDFFKALQDSVVPEGWRLKEWILGTLSFQGEVQFHRFTRKFGIRAKMRGFLQMTSQAGPQYFLGGADPRIQPVAIPLKVTVEVPDRSGQRVGEAHVVAGNQEGSFGFRRPDGTILSAKTTRGRRNHQEDGIYTSWFALPDGTEVKVIAGADGAGGEGGGDVASSAWLQGIHAGVAEAAREGRVPLAGELFEQGVTAVQFQRNRPLISPRAGKATGAGSVIVLVGDQATIATAGDSMVVFASPTENGVCKSVGYTDVDSVGSHSAMIMMGIDGAGGRHLYHVSGLAPRSRFVFGSDGLLENTIGLGYKDWGSSIVRMFSVIGHRSFQPPPTSVQLAVFDQILAATAGLADAGSTFHDVAFANMEKPGQAYTLTGQVIQLPVEADYDNIFVLSVELGSVSAYPLKVPASYQPLEPIGH